MDEFKQMKLSKTEWISIEKKLLSSELLIMNIIKTGYDNVLIQHNIHLTLSQYIKIDHKDYHYYIYIYIIKPILKSKYKKYNIMELKLKAPKQILNNADKIRIENIQNVEVSIEFILMDNYKKLIKSNKVKYYYNILYLLKHYTINIHLKEIVLNHISSYNFKPTDILLNCNQVIENNSIFDYSPIELHQHQKDIYTTLQKKERCLIFYTSPTSSGKTITPIGICSQFKVIFICASRHIGVNLAKSAINVGVKTGFAFGCSSNADIRLHYFSVNTYTNDKFKNPVHLDGSKLDLLISDIHSYEYAMKYMLEFFDKENIVLFWDEPTISMDYDEHPLHNSLSRIWQVNEIPRIILSSATLPTDLDPIIHNFKLKFDGTFYKIETTDYNSNIILMDNSNQIIMPNNYFNTIDDVKTFIAKKGNAYLKFLSLGECSNYILNSAYKEDFNQYSIQDINSYKIKSFYYEIIQKELFKTQSSTNYKNDTMFTTKSACNITYGPAIWIIEDVDSYIHKLISEMQIQPSVLEKIEKKIKFNCLVSDKIDKFKKDYQDKIAKDEGNENKMKNQRFSPEVIQLSKHIEKLESSFVSVQLDALYIPNTYEHFSRWSNIEKYNSSNVFKGDLDESYVNRIMNTKADFNYKVLLLLGIGILHQNDVVFNDIMKELADAKKLMLILATSDYIYGTNYQFSHGYLSDDIVNITQEKIIQSIGRVGRKEKNRLFTFRFLSDSYTHLFFETKPSKEGKKMNELFDSQK